MTRTHEMSGVRVSGCSMSGMSVSCVSVSGVIVSCVNLSDIHGKARRGITQCGMMRHNATRRP